jgi:hypothetical protein
MEREILIANTKTQKRSKITTSATTLGELKADLRAAGIDYSNMTFTEGISKTQLLNDATQLPQNVMYKGQPTNNLVILLTNTKKNISSGTMTRKEAYQAIKDNNLQDAVKEEFGRNFTQVPTSDLLVFIAQNGVSEITKTLNEEPTEVEDEDAVADELKDEEEEEMDENLPNYIEDIITDLDINTPEDSLYAHIAMLVNNDVLSVEDLENLKDDIDYLIKVAKKEKGPSKVKTAPKPSVSTSDGSITDNDIDDMLDELGV